MVVHKKSKSLTAIVMNRIALHLVVGLIILGLPHLVFGDTMQSTNFVITSDDLTAGGGNSTSTSFISEGDTGGTATGENGASTNFAACAGFPCTLDVTPPSITFSVSPNSVGLGVLSPSSVATGTTTLSVTENASNGYAITAIADGQLRTTGGDVVPDVSDGTVTSGGSEYGIGLTGTDRAFADDRSVTTSARTVASNAGSVTNSNITVTFKAAASTTTAAGNYAQTVTFVCTGTF